MIADADIGSLKVSPQYLISIWTTLVKFEKKKNHIVQITQNFELLDKKCLTILGKVLTPF